MSSNEVNYLIWRYLQESGFEHTTFAFQHESGAHLEDNRWSKEVSAGALINVLQKGLQYMEVEAHVDKNGSIRRCMLPFSLIGRHLCENVETVLPEVIEVDLQEEKEKGPFLSMEDSDIHDLNQGKSLEPWEIPESKELKEPAESKETSVFEESNESIMEDLKISESSSVFLEEKSHLELETSIMSPTDASWLIKKMEKVVLLCGHQENVFTGAWNPVYLDFVATASADATVRIWKLMENDTANSLLDNLVLNCTPLNEKKDITSISWDNSGNYIAAGSYDGEVRIWSLKGVLIYLFTAHHGPIMGIKWNSKNNLLLTASCDSYVIAWDMFNGTLKHVYDKRPCAITDIEWISDETFASSGKDGSLDFWSAEKAELLRRWEGHSKEINSIKFNSHNNLLLSCSDDFTIKIWSLDISSPQKIFLGHSKSVVEVQWKPQQKTDEMIIFVSCSLDGTIKVWNTIQSSPLHSLSHGWAFFTISFNPSGDILAAGTKDGSVILYDIKEGYLCGKYDKSIDKNPNKNSVIEHVFDVSWSKKGDRIIVCRANSVAEVIYCD